MVDLGNLIKTGQKPHYKRKLFCLFSRNISPLPSSTTFVGKTESDEICFFFDATEDVVFIYCM